MVLTGHSPQHLRPGARLWARSELHRLACKLRDEHGTTTGISGMALGADLWWADAVVRAGMVLHAHVPSPQQPDQWTRENRATWQRLLGHAAKTVTYGTGSALGLLHARNRGMVDNSDQVIGVWNLGRGGDTREALEYGVRRGHRPIWVDPELQVTGWPEMKVWRQILVSRRTRQAA